MFSMWQMLPRVEDKDKLSDRRRGSAILQG